MIRYFLFLVLLATRLTADISPETVVIVYNSQSKNSKLLAEYYALKRNIPANNLVGIATSLNPHISRAEYDTTIAKPLSEIFTRRNWWTRERMQDGTLIPTSQKIKLIVCMHGVPFGITRLQLPASEIPANNPIAKSNEASVDSELTLLGIPAAPTQGAIPSPFYKQDRPSGNLLPLSACLLVGRIDGPDLSTCKRMIDDAIATEATGLWGMCYLDLAKKGAAYQEGDTWISNIEKANWQTGIPTTIDTTPDTYVSHYPMRDAAFYYGWYTTHHNGPFLNPAFELRRGAIAVHLHSFSAHQLRQKDKHWTGPLLNKGAAATLGNVFEPYLALTHHFDIFHAQLLSGSTFIEAAYSAMPALSWQGVAIGDPLYRPFLHLDGSGTVTDDDKFYRALRVATQRWGTNAEVLSSKLQAVGKRKNDGRYFEALGLRARHLKDTVQATLLLTQAQETYLSPSDKIRITLQLVEIYRESGQKDRAIQSLVAALRAYPSLPESLAIKATLNILQPPPPPAATPKQR